MTDGDSPEQLPRPLKPILPPLTGIPPRVFAAAQIPEELLPPEEKEKRDRERKEFQKLAIRRELKKYVLEKLASFVEFVLLATASLIIVYLSFITSYRLISYPTAIGKWEWIVRTSLIFAFGYILLRHVESRFGSRLRFPNPFLAYLIRFSFADKRRLMQLRLDKNTETKSRYLLDNQQVRITFKNIALPEEASECLKRLVDFMKQPQKYQRLGANVQPDFLFVGPPGTGKTLAAHAVAGEANVPLFQLTEPVSNLSEFHEFLDQGQKNRPSILFIDNLDSIVRSRSIWPDPQNLGFEAMTTALLSFLDSHSRRDGVLVLAATNRPDLIDEALIRPGRLSVVEISYPKLQAVESIVKIHTRKIPLAEDVDVSIVARRLLELCPDCTGALIAESCNRAATMSAEKSAKVVNLESLLNAVEELCKRRKYSDRNP